MSPIVVRTQTQGDRLLALNYSTARLNSVTLVKQLYQ